MSQDWNGRKVRTGSPQRISFQKGWPNVQTQRDKKEDPHGWGSGWERRGEVRGQEDSVRKQSSMLGSDVGPQPVRETELRGEWRQEAQRGPHGVARGCGWLQEGAAGWMDSAWGPSPGLSPSVHPLRQLLNSRRDGGKK